MRDVTDELAELLRGMEPAVLEQYVDNAREVKCWYFWTPPTIDSAHYDLQEEGLEEVCPEWRTKNAYYAVMAFLHEKRRATKASFQSFYMPEPRSGHAAYVNQYLDTV